MTSEWQEWQASKQVNTPNTRSNLTGAAKKATATAEQRHDRVKLRAREERKREREQERKKARKTYRLTKMSIDQLDKSMLKAQYFETVQSKTICSKR